MKKKTLMILYLREAKSYGQFHIRLTECFTPFCNQTVVCWKVVQQNLFWPNVDFQLYLSTENIRIIKRKTWKKTFGGDGKNIPAPVFQFEIIAV